LSVDNRTATLSGEARRDIDSTVIQSVQLAIDISDVAEGTPVPQYVVFDGLGAARLSISGAEGHGNTPSRLDTRVEIDSFVIKLVHGRELKGMANADSSLVSGTQKLEVNSGRITTGRSTFDFEGAIGPAPQEPDAPP